MQINSAKDLTVYTKAYELAMRVFKLQEFSGGGEIRLDWSNSSVFTFGMFESARGLGEAEI